MGTYAFGLLLTIAAETECGTVAGGRVRILAEAGRAAASRHFQHYARSERGLMIANNHHAPRSFEISRSYLSGAPYFPPKSPFEVMMIFC